MNAKLILFVVCLGTYSLSTDGKTNCDTLGINFYDNIGCARQNKGGDCPSYENCKYELQSGKCLYNGKILGDGEEIPQKGLCYFGCRCLAKNNTEGTFLCASGQCGIFPPSPPGSNIECYMEYKLDSCCGSQRCEPSKVTCEVEGNTYREGERFSSKRECSECICTSEFNGKYEGPHCQRRPCGTEIYHAADIAKNCAPVYYKREGEEILCCPDDFVCPSSEDKTTEFDNNLGLTCKYGNKTVKSGTVITRDVEWFAKTRKVTCECKLPPLLTCTADL